MGNCYLFNPADAIVELGLNNGDLGPIAAATAGEGYAPQSMSVPTARHEDIGVLAIAEPNVLSAYYPDDSKGDHGPYVVEICLAGRNISVDDDVIITVGRKEVVAMTARGFVVDTRCGPQPQSRTMINHQRREKNDAR